MFIITCSVLSWSWKMNSSTLVSRSTLGSHETLHKYAVHLRARAVQPMNKHFLFFWFSSLYHSVTAKALLQVITNITVPVTHTSGLPIQISWIRAFIPRKESGDRRGIRSLLARGDPGAMKGKASSSSAQGGREGDERGREGSSPASENQNLGVFSSRDPWTNVFLFLALIIGLLRWSLLPRCTC